FQSARNRVIFYWLPTMPHRNRTLMAPTSWDDSPCRGPCGIIRPNPHATVHPHGAQKRVPSRDGLGHRGQAVTVRSAKKPGAASPDQSSLYGVGGRNRQLTSR